MKTYSTREEIAMMRFRYVVIVNDIKEQVSAWIDMSKFTLRDAQEFSKIMNETFVKRWYIEYE
jgi:hypothetical protein